MTTAEGFALGELRLLPWEFERLTPRELLLRAAAVEEQWERLARLLAWIAQPSYKTQLTPAMLLRGRPRAPH